MHHLNTVQTVLTERSTSNLACLLHSFWDDTNHDGFSSILMDMLAVYVKHCSTDVHPTRQPDSIVKFVSETIQLNERLVEIMNEEKPWQWIDTINGWELPPKTGE